MIKAVRLLIVASITFVLAIAATNVARAADIEVLSWRIFPDTQLSTGEYLNMRAVGEIRNTSNRDLGEVIVEVRFYDSRGKYVIGDLDLIGISVFQPGATATFDAEVEYRPDLKKAKLYFRTFDGIPLTASYR